MVRYRVILSNYFDTTFDEYCFTDDVTGAGIVTEVKNTLGNFYMVSEWETQLKKHMTPSFDMVSLGFLSAVYSPMERWSTKWYQKNWRDLLYHTISYI